MVRKQVAPYGEWESAISLEDTIGDSKNVFSPRADVTHEDGNDSDSPAFKLVAVLPEPHGVSTAVYEYGGGAYEVLPASGQHQRIIFSDAQDTNAVKVLDVDSGSVSTVVSGTSTLRYADFGPVRAKTQSKATDGSGGASKLDVDWVLAVEEDHEHPEPKDVKNYVVAINLPTGRVLRLVEGADFYTGPRVSEGGAWAAWREWNHPEMAWTNSRLCLASLEVADGDISLDGAKVVLAGGKLGEAVGDPAWGLDGGLYFVHEIEESDWRHLFRFFPGCEEAKVEKLELEGMEEVEVGDCSMMMDQRTFAFLSETSLVLTYTKFASYTTVHIDLSTLKVTPLDMPLVEARWDPLAALSPTSFVMIGAGITTSQGVYHFTLDSATAPTAAATKQTTVFDSLAHKSYPRTIFSRPEHIHFTSQRAPHRPIHGFYWPPHNPRFTAPDPSADPRAPPLLVMPHGGPTGHSCAGLQVGSMPGANAQLYTSRGFGYFAINYTGSSAHGKAYRARLNGQWGVLDRDDVVEAVAHLASAGKADSRRVGIHGGSAGGYNVLQSLVWYPHVFAAGACYCGVSDMQTMAESTHKLESQYLDGLLYGDDGGRGWSEARKKQRAAERSPLQFAERIRAPLLLIHGSADTVVPVQQSLDVADKVRGRGGEVEMVVVEGEGHMFKTKQAKEIALRAEFGWFMRILVGKEIH
ncbi:Alpha/Beta hydrolase protein [Coniella lustricola]|uniref:Alpha/Beta hydrolase protein n=1 Tax=Coniella lustricola TaxID=2025994 RepID=A0A2T2ZS77_9PEZI|nr:Alpha/Beta hydrolase protein [Coniella lustricola]